jgi:hypothetical protein
MDGSWDENTGTMRFIVDTTLCGISGEALQDLAQVTSPLDRATLQGVYRQYESAIRQKAAQKIRAGEFQANRTILISCQRSSGSFRHTPVAPS